MVKTISCNVDLFCYYLFFFGLFFERPGGPPAAKDLLPGLIFIEPYILSKLIGSVQSLEGTFWSLYVEFKFYIIAAFLYFLIGSRKLVMSLFILFLLGHALVQLEEYSDNFVIHYLSLISHHLSFKYFGWFAAGSSFYLFTKEGNKIWFYLGLIMCVCSSLATAIVSSSLSTLVAILCISILFSYSLISQNIQRVLNNKILLFLGYVSYPLYLLHENMMISLIIKFNTILPSSSSFLLPVFAIIFIASIAFVIAKYIEKPMKSIISNNIIDPISKRISVNR